MDLNELPAATATAISGLDKTTITQVTALFKAGATIEQIGTSLGLETTAVKTALLGVDPRESGLSTDIDFSPVDLALVKARMLQHALNGSEAVSSKMCMFIASQKMVSTDTKFRANARLTEGDKGTVINNIVVGVAEAKRLADLYNPDRAVPAVTVISNQPS